MYVCMYVDPYVYRPMYVCMYVCRPIHVCMYVCIYMYVLCMYTCMYVGLYMIVFIICAFYLAVPFTGVPYGVSYGTRCPAHEYGTTPKVECRIHAPGIEFHTLQP